MKSVVASFGPNPATLKRLAAAYTLTLLVFTWRQYLLDHEILAHLPAIPGFEVPLIVHQVIFGFLILSLGFTLVKPLRWEGPLAVLLFFGLAIFLDINRFSPALQHVLFLLLLPTSIGGRAVKMAIVCMLGVTYILAGLNKLNPMFQALTVPWIGSTLGLSDFSSVGKIIPWAEVLIGIFLFVRPIRLLVTITAIAMHTLLIVWLLTIGWDQVVIPWNGLCIVLLTIISISKEEEEPAFSIPLMLAVLGFTFVAVAGYLNVIHGYFGFPLYSGHMRGAMVVFPIEKVAFIPEDCQGSIQYFEQDSIRLPYLDLVKLGLDVHGNQPFPSDESFKHIARRLQRTLSTNEFILMIRESEDNTIGKGVKGYLAEDL